MNTTTPPPQAQITAIIVANTTLQRLVWLCNSANAAVMLSHAIACSFTPEANESDGWFAKPLDEWEQETHLSPHEQIVARQHLRYITTGDGTPLWTEAKRDKTRVLHYRVNFAVLSEILLT